MLTSSFLWKIGALMYAAGAVSGQDSPDVRVNQTSYLSTLKAMSLPMDKIYGVNIGNWLVGEPWMSPAEWTSMGGEFCDDCSTCRQSEWSLATHLGQDKANTMFKNHWESWLTQSDVDGIASVGLNTVRIPLGFWILEDIVDRSHEPYAQGGLDELIRGLNMFKGAGLYAILDFHALPGVATSKQMFAGNCTSQVEFYDSPDDYNYKRAVTWGIVMAYLSHTHDAFSMVFSIEGVNEPTKDANQTPGLAGYYKSFVLGIRAIELALGITCDDSLADGALTNDIARSAFNDAVPILAKLSAQYKIGSSGGFDFDFKGALPNTGKITTGVLSKLVNDNNNCLSTQFMTQAWQSNGATNPTDSARGTQLYDTHIYYNFGDVAPKSTEESYLETICYATNINQAAKIKNLPLLTGEWSLATAFDTSNDWLKNFGDAQKLAMSAGGGWVFWNFKLDKDAQTYPKGGQYIQWSYVEAVQAGLLTENPADFFDATVCDAYLSSADNAS